VWGVVGAYPHIELFEFTAVDDGYQQCWVRPIDQRPNNNQMVMAADRTFSVAATGTAPLTYSVEKKRGDHGANRPATQRL